MLASQRIKFGLLIVILTFLLPGCSHITVPRGPIPVKMDVAGPLGVNREVSFENGVAESKLTLIGSQGGHKWFADYNVWTSFIIGQLESELNNRGVPVKPESGNVFRAEVDSAALYRGFAAVRCIVWVRIEKKDGTWSKSYEGNNASPATLSLYRAVDGAVYKAIVAILQDKDFKIAVGQ